MIWIAVTFRRPDNYDGSLPETFRVKKKWLRDGSETTETNLGTKEAHGELPSSRPVADRYLTTFFNKIEFEYIPAVRSQGFRTHLLDRLQRIILEESSNNGDLLTTVNELSEHIQGKINDIEKDFRRISNIQSSMAPPSDVASLFRSFDVSTVTGKNHRVALEQRGDGIQSQYLLSVLRYMYNNSSGYQMWAFEEPENSLEYSRVKSLSKDLCEDSKSAQIFVTTHSPAIINCDSENAVVLRVFRDDQSRTQVETVRNTSKSASVDGLDSDIGLEKMKSDIFNSYDKDMKRLELITKEHERLKNIETSTVYTEGKTDAVIIRHAYEKIRGVEPPFDVKPADPYGEGGTQTAGGARMARKFAETVTPSTRTKTIVVFDNDDEGRRQFDSLSNNFVEKSDGMVKEHQNGASFAIKLPTPQFRLNDKNICIEKMFENDVLQLRTADGYGLTIQKPIPKNINLDNGQSLDTAELSRDARNVISQECKHMTTVSGDKHRFANSIVPGLAPDEFTAFHSLIDTIESILDD
jgi:hypothetical protein